MSTRVRNDERRFPLALLHIDAYSEHLDETLAAMGVERRNGVRIRLTLEEALLRMRDHFGDDAEVTATISSGFGGSYVRLVHTGAPFNPLGTAGADDTGPVASLLTTIGLQPHYAYTGRDNVLRLPFPRRETNPVLQLAVAFLAGAGAGTAGKLLLSGPSQLSLISTILDPLFKVWIRTLNALAAPVIFFMVMTTLLSMRKIDERGGSRHHMIVRYFLLSFLVGFIAVFVAASAYGLAVLVDEVGMPLAQTVLGGITQVVPENILEPFASSNTPQLLLVAFVLGNAIIALGEQAGGLTRLVGQINMANSMVTKWASSLVPLLSGLLIALEIWNGQIAILAQMWSPLLLSLAVSLVVMLAQLLYVCMRLHASPAAVARALWPPFAVAVRAGTLDDAYGEAEHSCVHGLGIDQTLTDVALPQGLVLFMPASIVGTLIFTVFNAQVFGVQTSVMWYVTAVVLDVVLFVATPPVPGANLLAFIVLFGQLGIPQEAFLDAMIFDIVFGLFANAANQSMLQLELALQAHRIGLRRQ